MLYKYTHTQTEATTGYFSCDPEPPLPLDAVLTHLVERPLIEHFHSENALAAA